VRHRAKEEVTVSDQQLQQVFDKWQSDQEFRQALRRDPDAALRDAGIALGDEGREALKGIDWRLPDEQLQERVSKLRAF
jgi:hypothetical protein